MEKVLQNINKLNRSLEGVIAVRRNLIGPSRRPKCSHVRPLQVGNEFSQVEGLWSQFENVMAKDTTNPAHDESKAAKDDGATEEGARR